MKVFILCFLWITMLLIHQNPVFAQTHRTAKATTTNPSYMAAGEAPVLNFNGTINRDRILLNWILVKNELVDQIEIEKSIDDKKFVMAGLVFGTDEPDKVKYMFYENNKNGKSFYRLKIINKDLTVSYSPVITPEPAIVKR